MEIWTKLHFNIKAIFGNFVLQMKIWTKLHFNIKAKFENFVCKLGQIMKFYKTQITKNVILQK